RARRGLPSGVAGEGSLVAARFGPHRARLGAAAAARRLLDRGGGVAEPVERAGARFQRRLPSQNVFELLFVLLLIDQLPTRKAVDLGAQLGDAILIGGLHLRLPRNEPGAHVLAEGGIGGAGNAPR